MRTSALVAGAILVLLVASGSEAAIYSWVDDEGRLGLADDLARVPAPYRDRARPVELLPSAEAAAPAPEPAPPPPQVGGPAPPRVPTQGDFAVALAGRLGLGGALRPAEAMTALWRRGIGPPAGWLPDAPATPIFLEVMRAEVAGLAFTRAFQVDPRAAVDLVDAAAFQIGARVLGDFDTISQAAAVPVSPVILVPLGPAGLPDAVLRPQWWQR